MLDELRAGEVHRAETQIVSPGGKGTLVVRGLQLLGASCQGVAPVAGDVGSVIRQLFRAEGLPMRVDQVDGQSRIAVTLAEVGRADTNINGPGPDAIGPRWRKHVDSVADLLMHVQPRYFVIAGRPPLSAAVEDVRRLIGLAAELQARVVVDISSPFLEQVFQLRPWLVKINALEARQATSSNDQLGASLVTSVLRLGAENAIITDGSRTVSGSIEGVTFEATPPSVRVASAVGCGDSFLAGLLASLSVGGADLDLINLIQTAVAVGSASAEDLRPGYFLPERATDLTRRVVVYAVG